MIAIKKFELLILFVFVHFSYSYCEDNSIIGKIETSQYTNSPDSIKLEISVSKEKINVLEPLLLCIAAENISDSTLRIDWSDNIFKRFSFQLLKNNQKVPYTVYGKSIFNNPHDSVILFMGSSMYFQPGQRLKCHYLINRLYDTSMAGDYILSATCSFKDSNNKKICNAKSNKLKIVISDEKIMSLQDFSIEKIDKPTITY